MSSYKFTVRRQGGVSLAGVQRWGLGFHANLIGEVALACRSQSTSKNQYGFAVGDICRRNGTVSRKGFLARKEGWNC